MSINDKPKFSDFFLALVSSDPKLLRKTEGKTAQKRGGSLCLCGPVFVIQCLLKVGNMSVANLLARTNPIYINHMIVLTAVDSSGLCYWTPSILDAQCELHHFAQAFLQAISDYHCASLARARVRFFIAWTRDF